MRVIAGEAKGRRLVAVKGGGTRSATDRIRETLFAILEPRLTGARVLDLFAGAGTLGIEALSRGAAQATFVERAPAAVAALRQNLAATGLADRGAVVPTDVPAFLQGLAAPYELVFCDPPFSDVALLGRVLASDRLIAAARDGLVIVRVLRKYPPDLPPALRVARERVLGEESLLFLAQVDAPA